MPLSFDAASGGTQSAGTSLTYSHTVGVGADRILFVGINFFAADAADDITGVTYAGVAMTQITKQSIIGTNQQWSYLYYLVNPTSGANNVVINKTSTDDIRSNSASYAGASQLAQPDASITDVETAATTISQSLTTIADNCWVVSFAMNSATTIVAGTGTTARANQTFCAIGDNNAAKTPPGSVSMQWTNGGSSTGWTMIMASILPKEAEPASTSANPMFFSTGGGTLG